MMMMIIYDDDDDDDDNDDDDDDAHPGAGPTLFKSKPQRGKLPYIQKTSGEFILNHDHNQ